MAAGRQVGRRVVVQPEVWVVEVVVVGRVRRVAVAALRMVRVVEEARRMAPSMAAVVEAAEALFEPAQYDDLWATLPLAPTAIGVVVRKGGDPDLGAAPGGAAAKKKDDFETATGLTGKRGKRKKGARK